MLGVHFYVIFVYFSVELLTSLLSLCLHITRVITIKIDVSLYDLCFYRIPWNGWHHRADLLLPINCLVLLYTL